jgi:regulator of replication initiation timing
MAAVLITALVAVGTYALVLGPKAESQTLEIERLRQEAAALQRENEALQQKTDELHRTLESLKLERQNAAPPSPTQKRPKQRPEPKRAPKPDRLANPACNENDPLCGI